jgi:hypothetical protein
LTEYLFPNGNKKIKQQAFKARTEIVADLFLPNLFTIDWKELFDYGQKETI